MATRGRSATAAIKNAHFISPVKEGAVVSYYTEVIKTGKTSVQINVKDLTSNISIIDKPTKIADGLFVFVTIDEQGKR